MHIELTCRFHVDLGSKVLSFFAHAAAHSCECLDLMQGDLAKKNGFGLNVSGE